MNEIEQAAKEYAEKPKHDLNSFRDIQNCKIDFTAGAEFYKNALSQKFEGLRDEFFKEVEEFIDPPDANDIHEWFKEKMLK